MDEGRNFGCEKCYGESAQAVDRHFRDTALGRCKTLVDESHFIVNIRWCVECGQDFVSVFTERIDWAHGEDPQERALIPISPEERRGLEESFQRSQLLALGSKRRIHCWSSDGQVGWQLGGFRIPHHD